MNSTIASRKTLLALIAINGMVFVYWVVSLPGAFDFQAFYFAGETVRRAPEHVYDLRYQQRGELAEFKTMGEMNGNVNLMPFFHPPHELLLFGPLSKLPFAASLNLWRALNLLCLVLSGIIIARAIGTNVLDTVLLVAAVYPVAMCLANGQDSLLVLLLVSGCLYLLKTERNVWAAAVLALALFKPQLPVVLAVAMLAAGKKRFFAWFAVFGFALAAGSMVYVGWTGTLSIMKAIELGELFGYAVPDMPTVRGMLAFAGLNSRWFALALLAAGVLAMVPLWRRSRSLEFAAASSICLGSAMVIYLYVNDLVLLAIPLVVVLDAFARGKMSSPALTPIIAAVTSGPLSMMGYYRVIPSFLLLLPTLALGYMTMRMRLSEDHIRDPIHDQAST